MTDDASERISVQPMRDGWTLIELIFVIIIIAILGSIAIKSLAVTRDDAKLSADVSNMNVCLKDLNNIYTATRTALKDINTTSCNMVECYNIDINGTTVDVTLNSDAAIYCTDVENVGGHHAGRYELGGSVIKR